MRKKNLNYRGKSISYILLGCLIVDLKKFGGRLDDVWDLDEIVVVEFLIFVGLVLVCLLFCWIFVVLVFKLLIVCFNIKLLKKKELSFWDYYKK